MIKIEKTVKSALRMVDKDILIDYLMYGSNGTEDLTSVVLTDWHAYKNSEHQLNRTLHEVGRDMIKEV